MPSTRKSPATPPSRCVRIVLQRSCTQPPLYTMCSTHLRTQVVLEVPGWCSFLPVPAIQSTGSRVLQQVLDIMVPRFLAQLERDYQQWAAGDTSRTPVGTGQL